MKDGNKRNIKERLVRLYFRLKDDMEIADSSELYTEKNSIRKVFRENVGIGSVASYTIVSKNYLHYALTLRDSYLKHNPGARFFIFFMDKLSNNEEVLLLQSILDEGVEIIGFEEVLNHTRKNILIEMLFKYTILEMNTGIKPYAIEYLFNQGYQTEPKADKRQPVKTKGLIQLTLPQSNRPVDKNAN